MIVNQPPQGAEHRIHITDVEVITLSRIYDKGKVLIKHEDGMMMSDNTPAKLPAADSRSINQKAVRIAISPILAKQCLEIGESPIFSE